MIKKTNRLKKSHQIKVVFNKGKGLGGEFFRVKFFKRWGPSSSESSKLAVIIAKKSVKRAVDRNRIRRRIQAAFYPLITDARGFDIVVLPNANVRQADFEKIKKEAKRCLDILERNSSRDTKKP